ncbi:MAG: superoxide dismutase, partial [Bacteroidales bacterium]|nr:superoxide dismutase [Bacteroidales bacterium]
FFWTLLGPEKNLMPSEKLEKAINKQFGSMDKLKEQFINEGMMRFGSGWVWLIVDANGNLAITSTPNQDNPLMDDAPVKGKPILSIDVWEHAYYLKYQNKRKDYLLAIWQVINWKKVSEYYDEITQ